MAIDPALVEAIFSDAISYTDRSQRSAFLDNACDGNTELRNRLEALLRSHQETGAFLLPPDELPQTSQTPPSSEERAGSIIGPYKLLQQIGEGGFGSVFMAEQEKPFIRKVALKIIKLGMDTRQVIARFEAERQALAMMEHPNIAKVLDAGATTTGRPYFVMELVRGVPITEYCDSNKLSTQQRLELFIPVCRAIQHAHQKGIIHRDIKPSNVLVTMHDGVPVPKVIDFGIAKATTQRLTEKTLFTEFRQFVGTPEYMSPEQAEMSGLDIDTRSDIYSLGVLLYELLTGTTPIASKQLRSASFGEIQRLIRDVDPPRPSTRISTLGETLATTAAHRSIDGNKLGRLVRGELDWIVMRCLEKDRTRRYDTANGVAADVNRYLKDEAVEASPPSATYRLRKLTRRYRNPLRAAALFALLLVAATIFSAWQAVRANRAKAVALIQMHRADTEAATAKKITESLQQLLGAADPDASKGPNYTVRQLLEDFADSLGDKLANQPEAEASLQRTIGRAFAGLGSADKATRHLARALELRRQISGEQSNEYAEALVDYTWSFIGQNKDINAEGPNHQAETLLRKALAIYHTRNAGGAPVIRALQYLQIILQRLDRLDDIEPVVNEALAVARQSPGVEFPELANIYHGLIIAKIAQGKLDEAEQLGRTCVAMHLRVQGPTHPETGWGYHELANALTARHKFAEAIDAEQQALAIFRKAYPPNHWSVGMSLDFIMSTLQLAADSSALAQTFPSPQPLNDLESLFRDAAFPAHSPDNREPALAPDPVAARCLAQLPHIYFRLSQELSAKDQTREAEEYRNKGTALIQSLTDQYTTNPDQLADLYAGMIPGLIADGQQQQASTLGRKLLSSQVKDSTVFENTSLAVARSIYPDRDLVLALSKKATDLNPASAIAWTIHGHSEYLIGNYPQAVSDLQKSLALSVSDNTPNLLFLAMSHWKLGEKALAQQEYAQAVGWMGQHHQQNSEFIPFREEAERLMGLPHTAASTSAPSTAPRD